MNVVNLPSVFLNPGDPDTYIIYVPWDSIEGVRIVGISARRFDNSTSARTYVFPAVTTDETGATTGVVWEVTLYSPGSATVEFYLTAVVTDEFGQVPVIIP